MKQNKWFVLLLALILAVSLLTGCGARAPMENAAADAPAADAPMEAPSYESGSLTDSAQPSSSSLPTDRKLIITVNMEAETEDLDATLLHINSKITALNGYMEAQEIYNGSIYSSYRHRNASMTIRIPAENLNQFVDMVTENCNIISNYRTSEDVTLTYVSIESRIAALEVEQERLLALLEQADNMEDLLTIESRLTDVRYELEQVASQMRVMENQINYSTIHLYLNEVVEYSEVEEEPETFGQRVSRGFVRNIKALWNGVVEVAIFFITGLPYFILLGGIAVAVILIIRRVRRKTEKSKEKE